MKKPTEYPMVCIIIFNWNDWKGTIDCLESLYKITNPNYDVIVVYNGSEEESVYKRTKPFGKLLIACAS